MAYGDYHSDGCPEDFHDGHMTDLDSPTNNVHSVDEHSTDWVAADRREVRDAGE